ncbi:MAG: thioredoxin reductase, partial [Chloroflexota bacterium]|nr:thioredoxin reductase [Chloroflexota bacterium]
MPERRPILLAVGDDAETLRALTRDLRRRYRNRFRILRAPDGERAMATLRALAGAGQPVALVIADQGLATMSGLDLLARIRDLLQGTRTVLLTPYSKTEAAIRAIDAGAVDDYVVKPWDPPEDRLCPVLDDLLDDWTAEHAPRP